MNKTAIRYLIEKQAAYITLPSNNDIPVDPVKGQELDDYINRGSTNMKMLNEPIKRNYNTQAKDEALRGLVAGGILGAGLGAAFPFGNKGRMASSLISGAVTAPIFAAADAARPLVEKRQILNKREKGLKEYQDALISGERNLYRI